MFANPAWSVLILLLFAILYMVLRWRHGGPLLASRADVDGWWSRQVARLWAFRSWIWNAAGGVLIAAPDVIVALLPIDLTPLIGTDWAQKIGSTLLIANAVNTVFKVRPPGQQA